MSHAYTATCVVVTVIMQRGGLAYSVALLDIKPCAYEDNVGGMYKH